MRSVVTNNLSAQLRRHASAFQLLHVSFRSFFRKWGYAPELAASDIVHAVTAHLESEPKTGASGSDKFWCVFQERANDAGCASAVSCSVALLMHMLLASWR